MAYSLKFKEEVLKQVRQGMSLREASRRYKVSCSGLRKWVMAPPGSTGKARIKHRTYSIELKVEVLRLLEDGKISVPQIADFKNINQTTIYGWIRDKPRIFAVYSSQGQRYTGTREEMRFMGMSDDRDTKQHIRALEDENEFLKAKVAYLEALMEISGIPASGVKKKPGIKPSAKSSDKGSET